MTPKVQARHDARDASYRKQVLLTAI
jgi:hypothetical protein